MYDFALGMQIVQPNQHLPCKLAHKRNWNATIIVVLDQRKQIITQHLKHHANVLAIGANMGKGIKQLYTVTATMWVIVTNLGEQ